jgi:hypothetical protein
LPIPGELLAENPITARVSRIARLGASLESRGGDEVEPPTDPSSKAADLETRLFFQYLAGDYAGAAAALDALDGHITAPEHRLATLSVKAQIFVAQGQRLRAQSVIDYVQSVQGAETRRVEETPFGLVMTKELTSSQAWARHLAQRACAPEPAKSGDDALHPGETPDQPLHDSIIPAPPQPIEGRGGDVPLQPIFRRFDGLDR